MGVMWCACGLQDTCLNCKLDLLNTIWGVSRLQSSGVEQDKGNATQSGQSGPRPAGEEHDRTEQREAQSRLERASEG